MIYFAQSGPDGYIKIGVTGRGSKSRISDNTMNPYPITLLAEMEGDETTEAALHKLFEHLRIKGEWFKPSQDLLDYIASVKKGNPTVVANLSEITPDAGCSWSCRATVGALVSALKNEKAENADLARERRRAVQGVGSLLREIETIHRALFKRALFGLDDKGFEGFEGILDDGVAWKRLCDLGAYPYTLRERLLSPRWEDPVV